MLHHKNKKNGYISIEYVIVTGVVVAAVVILFVGQFPFFANEIDLKAQGVINLISGDETVIN